MSDIEIAQNAKMKPIINLADELFSIPATELDPYGHYKAKLSLEYVDSLSHKKEQGKLILVTAISPTPAGEGKTTTTVGLGDALNRIGKKTIMCLREPSLGPCFGMKGGAAGGGYSQVVPMEDINLHFTGDFHAIGIAHNLLSAMIDNHINHGNALDIDPRRIKWKRVVDMNDRALRNITVGQGGPANGYVREDGYDIVVASEFAPYDAVQFKKCRRVVFVQSWCFMKMKFHEEDKDKSYRDLGFDHVISCGDYITKTVNVLNNEDCVTIANGIDSDVFFPDDPVRIKNRVMCLTRKNPQDIKTITSIVKREVPDVEFFYADGLNEQEIAEAYRQSDIMLASGYPEGLPLPPLEAMFSGAIVVGFTGRGGRQYMIDEETALVSEDGDCIDVAENLKLKISMNSYICQNYPLKIYWAYVVSQ